MQHTIFVATIATALLSSSLSVQAQSIRPEPIALPASEFPVPSATLDALITAENFTALRAHAWTLWSGVTADSTQTFKGAVLPIGKPGCQNGKSLPRLASRWHATRRGVFFSRSVARGSSTILSAKERGLPRSQSAVGPRGSTDFRRANENRLRLGNSKRRQMIAHSARVARKKRSVDTRIIFLYTAPVPAHLKGVVRFPCRAMRAGSGACGVGIGARVSGGSCKRRLADARVRRKTCARGRGQDAE